MGGGVINRDWLPRGVSFLLKLEMQILGRMGNCVNVCGGRTGLQKLKGGKH